MRRIARRAEESGYTSLWAFQRTLHPVNRELGPSHRSVHDPVTSLAYVAGHTERIGLGTATMCAPFTAPPLMAKAMASLDVLSHGRLTVGLGMGWLPEEHTAAGVPMVRRGERFEEYLRCLRALWTENPVEFAGDFYTVPPSYVGPPVVQRPHPPILIGGGAEPALRRAGRLAQGWIAGSGSDPSRIQDAVALVHDGAREAGRDPATLRILARLALDFEHDRTSGGRHPPHGSEQQIRRHLVDLRSRGVTEVCVDANLSPVVGTPDADPTAALERAENALEMFAAAVA